MRPDNLARKLLLALAGLIAIAHPLQALAEDIDIFVAGAGGSSVANVLIVIDNTSNWASARNMWPGGIYQGQAELKAIKTPESWRSSPRGSPPIFSVGELPALLR